MIKYKNQDITLAEELLIAHGTNCQGVMGSGVALAIRKKWPEAFYQYKLEYDKNGLKLGKVYLVHTSGKIIANCMTQEYYGRDGQRYVSYEAIDSCMRQLNEFCLEKKINEIAMSKIGSSLGGGDWQIIEKIIEKNLTQIQVMIYLGV